jgi:hypothetical protein
VAWPQALGIPRLARSLPSWMPSGPGGATLTWWPHPSNRKSPALRPGRQPSEPAGSHWSCTWPSVPAPCVAIASTQPHSYACFPSARRNTHCCAPTLPAGVHVPVVTSASCSIATRSVTAKGQLHLLPQGPVMPPPGAGPQLATDPGDEAVGAACVSWRCPIPALGHQGSLG